MVDILGLFPSNADVLALSLEVGRNPEEDDWFSVEYSQKFVSYTETN